MPDFLSGDTAATLFACLAGAAVFVGILSIARIIRR